MSNIELQKELITFSTLRTITDYINHEYSFVGFTEKRMEIIPFSKRKGIFTFK